MRIADSYLAKLLVFLAAVLLPCEPLLSGICACAGQNSTGDHSNSASPKASPCASPCCGGATRCCCCRKANQTAESPCCKHKTSHTTSSRSPVVAPCMCKAGAAPAPQAPPPAPTTAKHILGSVAIGIATLSLVANCPLSLDHIGQCPSVPSSPLDRLSNLCRLTI